MTDEERQRIEDALVVYDRTHVNPAYPDHRDPRSRDLGFLLFEVRRLRTWLEKIDRLTAEVEEPCGWCLELQGWARQALAGEVWEHAPPPLGRHAP